MSAERSPISVLPPVAHENADTDAAGSAPKLPAAAEPSAETGLTIATADLADLLANGQWGAASTDPAGAMPDAQVYDGHVALALDMGVLPAIDSTLDLLTSSHHLFDVPAVDVSSDPGDASSA